MSLVNELAQWSALAGGGLLLWWRLRRTRAELADARDDLAELALYARANVAALKTVNRATSTPQNRGRDHIRVVALLGLLGISGALLIAQPDPAGKQALDPPEGQGPISGPRLPDPQPVPQDPAPAEAPDDPATEPTEAEPPAEEPSPDQGVDVETHDGGDIRLLATHTELPQQSNSSTAPPPSREDARPPREDPPAEPAPEPDPPEDEPEPAPAPPAEDEPECDPVIGLDLGIASAEALCDDGPVLDVEVG